jgi:4-amino-4-deoxy-L-arabinose transferase-like glycosyltransferase
MGSNIKPWIWIALAVLIVAATFGRWVSSQNLVNPRFNQKRQVSGDEILYVALGDRLWKEGRYDACGLADKLPLDRARVHIPKYLEAPLFKHPPLFPFLVGLSRQLFWGISGASIYPSLLMGAVSLLAIFWLTRELGGTPCQALLATLFLAVSPVHWICSSRIWLDMTLAAFVLLAVTSSIRALKHPKWWKAAGLFWGCALLTKYTAFAGWGLALAALLWIRPELRGHRSFWIGQAIALAMFLPWMVVRIAIEGMSAGPVEDWETFGRVARWSCLAVAPVAAGLWVWLKCSRKEAWRKWSEPKRILGWGTILFLVIGFFWQERFAFGALPWAGWGPNALAHSPRDFYLIRQVSFEPVCWWGLLGLTLVRRDASWDLVRSAWFGLFFFLTLWGNFQLRYGLLLVPFELAIAALLLVPAAWRSWTGAMAAVWIGASCIRSLWIVREIAIGNKFFYF